VAPRVVRLPGVRWLAGRGFDLLRKVPDVTCPILIIQGGADEMTPVEMGRRIRDAARPGATLHVVPGGGHMSTHVEGDGGGFREALAGFLSAV
jgi:pimeloyl-ACP methyl ester carboxylesterase